MKNEIKQTVSEQISFVLKHSGVEFSEEEIAEFENIAGKWDKYIEEQDARFNVRCDDGD